MPRSRWHSLFARYVALAERRTMLLLAVFLAIFAATVPYAIKMIQSLHTNMAELLPDEHPAIQAYRRLAGRQKSATNLVMIIHSPSAEANRKLAELLRPELEKMVPEFFTEIQWKPDTEVAEFAGKYKWLYAEKKDLENAESFLDRIISKRSNPAFVDLEGDPDQELKQLRDKLNQKLPAVNPAKYFEKTDEKTGEDFLGIMMWRQLTGIATKADRDTCNFVMATAMRLHPEQLDPRMKVEFTGAIAEALDEQGGIREDLQYATIMCVLLVLFVIWLYFRRVGLLFVIGAPAVLGLGLALTLAWYTIHYLNINTAFLISIIIGNGINAPIVLLARYGEERQRARPVGEALTIAMSETLLGTLTAMAAASVAYGCLLLTSFRGFNQFGLLGGAGMLLVWLMSFLLVPPMVIFGERLFPGVLTPKSNLWRHPFGWLGRLAQRRPGVLALATLLGLGAAAGPLLKFIKDPLEWNFENLRTDDIPGKQTASQRLWSRMEWIGLGDMSAGYIGNNGVLLVDTPEQADPVADAMRKQDAAKGPLHVLKEVRTLSTALPKEQEEKLEILQHIRSKIDKHVALMDDAEKQEVQAWRPPEYLRKLGGADLPRQVREAFTETDGQRGRLIGIDADHSNYSDWNGHDLMRMSKALKVEALGKTWIAASTATIFAGMLETIIADGPRVTVAALLGVMILVLVAFGLQGASPVLTSLAIGVIWLGGCVGALKLKINFMNFVGLPITLGVGVDYAANIWARLRHEGVERVSQVIADTGSAVALCSCTTIIGYSSLLMSRNRALRSFGLLADIGEVTCLLAAVVALPALISYVRRKNGDSNRKKTAGLA